MLDDHSPFRILTVCTGNVCRSPLAERILQSGLDELAPGQFSVESAGLGALHGKGVPSEILDIADHFGVQIRSHKARQLEQDVFGNPDLILTMDRDHRSHLLDQFPQMLARTFTLRELARILPLTDPIPGKDSRIRWKTGISDARFSRFPPDNPTDDDVIDPYRRSNETYRLMAAQIVPAIRSILAWELRAQRR